MPTSAIVERDDAHAGDELMDDQEYEAWDAEEPAEWDEGVISYPAQNLPRRASGVNGVLNERTTDTSGITRIAMLVAGGAIVVVVVLAALLLFGGGDDNQAVAPEATETPTATLAAGTVIEIGSPTAVGTPADGTNATATATAAGTTTPAAGETAAAPTATESSGGVNPTAPAAQATATATATATPTTAAQPTATFTPLPTATPTVVPHPYGFNECVDNTCGNPMLVVCAPDAWFVDVPPYGNWPPEWPRIEVLTSGDAISACQ